MRGLIDTAPALPDLADCPDVRLGDVIIRPALRLVTGPSGDSRLEPRVMQVLLVLADPPGAVLSRDVLMQRCWPGVIVGEDSLTRAIGEIRRALKVSGSSQVDLETIPKTGYRLNAVGSAFAVADVATGGTAPTMDNVAAKPVSRRVALAWTGAALAAAAAGGWWLTRPDERAQHVDDLVAAGRDSWRMGLPETEAQGIGFLKEAVALDPESAEAWGMLALLTRNVAEVGAPADAMVAVGESETAARRALGIDPQQGEALAARAGLLPIFGDWAGTRGRLEGVLRAAPGQVAALSDLGVLEMSTGRMQAALAIAEQLAGDDPLAAVHQHKLVYRLWSTGRLAEMNQVADRALSLWPTHPAIWFARMWTYCYTGRTEAAQAMLADSEARPDMPPEVVDLFATTVRAVGSQAPAEVQEAVARNLASARKAPGAAVAAVQHLAALGAIDEAFDVARGYLLREGPVVGQLRHSDARMVRLNEQHRRKTMMLFIPATAPMRTDERFLGLMEAIGMADYWRKTGLTPDLPWNGAA